MVSSDQLKFLLLMQRLHNIHVDPDEEEKSQGSATRHVWTQIPASGSSLILLRFYYFFKVFFFLYNTFLIILKVIDGDYEYKILGEKLLREETPFQWVCKGSSLRSLWHK